MTMIDQARSARSQLDDRLAVVRIGRSLTREMDRDILAMRAAGAALDALLAKRDLPADPNATAQVTTTGELEALPIGTVVLSAAGTVACRFDDTRFVVFGDDRALGPWSGLQLPARVLFIGAGTTDPSCPACGDAHTLSHHGCSYCGRDDAVAIGLDNDGDTICDDCAEPRSTEQETQL